jgi:hypothetical protein
MVDSMLEVDGRRVSLKYAGKLGCFRVVAHDKVVMTDLSLACYSDKTFVRWIAQSEPTFYL